MSALRQTLRAGVSYGYLSRSPITWANPQPKPRAIRVFTPADLDKVVVELDDRCAAAVRFAADTGLRLGEWARVERRDVDRGRRILSVRGTKTFRSRREVPLTTTALAAIDSIPARLDSVYVFSGPTRAVRLRQLRSTGLGRRDRHGWNHEAGASVRPAVDVRDKRARSGRDRLRARPDHGDVGDDDRGALRRAARHRTRRDPRATGGGRRLTSAGHRAGAEDCDLAARGRCRRRILESFSKHGRSLVGGTSRNPQSSFVPCSPTVRTHRMFTVGNRVDSGTDVDALLGGASERNLDQRCSGHFPLLQVHVWGTSGARAGCRRGLNPAWLLVERAGFEPATFGLQSRRSPN